MVTADGTPTAGNYRIFASKPSMTSTVPKGYPHCVNAIRAGRADIVVTGGDISNGYATCSGMATQNDSQNNRWGLFQYQAGSYLWKGLWSLGTAGTLVDFRDSNRSIFIDATPRTYASFNRIEIRNSSSRVDWSSFTISALGTLSKGEFEMIDNATVNFSSCNFIDMSTFSLLSNFNGDSNTWRRTGQISVGTGNAPDDGITPLLTAQLYENILGSQTYRGQGAERRERLE